MKDEKIDMTFLNSNDCCQICEQRYNKKVNNDSLLLNCCRCMQDKFHPFCITQGLKNGTATKCKKCSLPFYHTSEDKFELELLMIPQFCWLSRKKRIPFIYPLLLPPLVIAILVASVYSQRKIWSFLLQNQDADARAGRLPSLYFVGVLCTYVSLSLELALAYLVSKWFFAAFIVWVKENPAISVFDHNKKIFVPRIYYPDNKTLLWYVRRLFYPATYQDYLIKEGLEKPFEVVFLHPTRTPAKDEQTSPKPTRAASPCPSTDSSDEFDDMELARSGPEFAFTSTPYANRDRKMSQKSEGLRFNMSAIQEDDEEAEDISVVVQVISLSDELTM